MKKETIIGSVIYISMMIGTVLLMWWIGSFFAKSVSDHEVISPRPGVECVVVSRMFNTSVDCWKI